MASQSEHSKNSMTTYENKPDYKVNATSDHISYSIIEGGADSTTHEKNPYLQSPNTSRLKYYSALRTGYQ